MTSNKKENSFGERLRLYYAGEGRRLKTSIVWEAKRSQKATPDKIYFKALKHHQERDLLLAEDDVLSIKIPDVRGKKRKQPPDGQVIYKGLSFMVCIFVTDKRTTMYEVPIRAWIKDAYGGERKFLSEERASTIGHVIHT